MFLLVSLIILVTDFIYLTLIKEYFNTQIFMIQGSKIKINLLSALLCYFLLVLSLIYFIIIPRRSLSASFLLGFIIYGVFELTNKSIFNDWKWSTVIIDTLWGGMLFLITTYLYKKLVTVNIFKDII
jgi:uncharacterized membrane protein